MKFNELDGLLLKDGRKVAIMIVHNQENFLVEDLEENLETINIKDVERKEYDFETRKKVNIKVE